MTLIRVSVEGHSVGMWSTCISPAMFYLLGHRNYSACVPALEGLPPELWQKPPQGPTWWSSNYTLSFHAGGMGSIPAWGTKIPHVVHYGPEVKKKKKKGKEEKKEIAILHFSLLFQSVVIAFTPLGVKKCCFIFTSLLLLFSC